MRFEVPVVMLGQSGCRLVFPGATIYVDPYLSDSVRELDAQDLQRLVPVATRPEAVVDADWVLLTHAHIDHCDPHTIPQIGTASPQARFIGPAPVVARLEAWHIDSGRISKATEGWVQLAADLRIRAVPAAHPTVERDANGDLSCVGYLLEYRGRKIYFAGDTVASDELLDALQAEKPIHTAFLPVNEHNYFKGRRGIIGNMSIREAFLLAEEIGANQVVPVHWDMFAVNSVHIEEIRFMYRCLAPRFRLLLRPTLLNLSDVDVSVVIRTLNEERYLAELLAGIADQDAGSLRVEVVLVDSGSTDATLSIAQAHGCRIQHIDRGDFSFGRSLNMGCEAAAGSILVVTSGHCVPADRHWLARLCQPVIEGVVDYAYGRQVGGEATLFSERRIFSKYFPEASSVPQQGFFCNNANSALSRSAWERYRFDELLTGLEDMELAQRLVREGGKVGYVADAVVLHHHHESWGQVRRRFEREAIALQRIMPHIHVSLADTLRYVVSSVYRDLAGASGSEARPGTWNILCYRWNQYVGAWVGNHQHRLLSHQEKEKYFFPD